MAHMNRTRWKAPSWKSEMNIGDDGVLKFNVKEDIETSEDEEGSGKTKKLKKKKRKHLLRRRTRPPVIERVQSTPMKPVAEKILVQARQSLAPVVRSPPVPPPQEKVASLPPPPPPPTTTTTTTTNTIDRSPLFPCRKLSDLSNPEGVFHVKKPWLVAVDEPPTDADHENTRQSTAPDDDNDPDSHEWVFNGDYGLDTDKKPSSVPTSSARSYTSPTSVVLPSFHEDDIDSALRALENFGPIENRSTPPPPNHKKSLGWKSNSLSTLDIHSGGSSLNDTDGSVSTRSLQSFRSERKLVQRKDSNLTQESSELEDLVEETDNNHDHDTSKTTSTSTNTTTSPPPSDDTASTSSKTTMEAPWILKPETIVEDEAFLSPELNEVSRATPTPNNNYPHENSDSSVQSNEDLVSLLRVPGMGSSLPPGTDVPDEDFETLFGDIDIADFYRQRNADGDAVVVECTCYRMKSSPKVRKKKKIVYQMKSLKQKGKKTFFQAKKSWNHHVVNKDKNEKEGEKEDDKSYF